MYIDKGIYIMKGYYVDTICQYLNLMKGQIKILEIEK